MTLLFTGSLKILCPLLSSSSILFYFHFYILTMLLHSFKHLSTIIKNIYIKIFKWKKCHVEDYSKRFFLTWNCLCLVTAVNYSSVISGFVLLHPVVLALFNAFPFYLHNTTSHLLKSTFPLFSCPLHWPPQWHFLLFPIKSLAWFFICYETFSSLHRQWAACLSFPQFPLPFHDCAKSKGGPKSLFLTNDSRRRSCSMGSRL